MGTQTSKDTPPGDAPGGDPWAVFGYLVAGVVFYGGIGLGLSVWLDAPYLVPIGIVVGAGFGMYMVFARFRYREEPGTVPAATTTARSTTASTPIDHDRTDETSALRAEPPRGRDDRGDSS